MPLKTMEFKELRERRPDSLKVITDNKNGEDAEKPKKSKKKSRYKKEEGDEFVEHKLVNGKRV